jgi:uncharacterized protein YqjF (DUF2071 family)
LGHPALQEVGHRPWPLPTSAWLWRQTWHDLVFLHWPVPASRLRPLVPKALTIDEHSGSAWVAVTPFWMSDVALRGLPPFPGASSFPELNVRTYVAHGDRAGVWFFSLDAASRLAVWAARRLFRLPYVYAHMRVRPMGARIHYSSHRPTGEGFLAHYEPIGPVHRTVTGSLEHFLTERYCLYALSRAGELYRADIHHVPWPLQSARVEVTQNDMLAANQLDVDGAPMKHYAKRLDVVIWPIRAVVR